MDWPLSAIRKNFVNNKLDWEKRPHGSNANNYVYLYKLQQAGMILYP